MMDRPVIVINRLSSTTKQPNSLFQIIFKFKTLFYNQRCEIGPAFDNQIRIFYVPPKLKPLTTRHISTLQINDSCLLQIPFLFYNNKNQSQKY